MKLLSARRLRSLTLALFATTCLQAATPTLANDSLFELLEGTYRLTPAGPEDTTTPLLLSRFTRVSAPAIGDHVVYWQMNQGAEERLYRQVLMVFTPDGAGGYTQASFALRDAPAFVDGHLRPDRFAELKPGDLTTSIGADCVTDWGFTGEWLGNMPHERCKVWSESKQQWRFIGSAIIPRSGELLYAERGVDDAGNLLFGQPAGEHYRMLRVTPADEPDAREIMVRATAAAGGDAWLNATTNLMTGQAMLYRDGQGMYADRYEMRRVYPTDLSEAHTNTGKFRLDAYRNDRLLFTISFDGTQMYSQNGPMPEDQARELAESSFGFSAVRFALTDGFGLRRMADDQVEGYPCWFVQVTDPAGGNTLVGVDKATAALRYVGWQTPRGWHHRLYSDYYTLPSGFVQPGRVRLYYDGVKTTDINWTAATLNTGFADDVFVIATQP